MKSPRLALQNLSFLLVLLVFAWRAVSTWAFLDRSDFAQLPKRPSRRAVFPNKVVYRHAGHDLTVKIAPFPHPQIVGGGEDAVVD
jgi:hypothetical protein